MKNQLKDCLMNLNEKIGSFVESSKRIAIISKKPSSEEFWQISKITGLGIIALALLGFLVFLLFGLLGIGR